MRQYDNEDYLRAEHLLKDGVYRAFEVEIEEVLTGCPLTKRLQPTEGYALKFKGADRVLGLGMTNFSLCCAITGDSDPETWVGKSVRLEVRKVRDRKATQPAIRIIPPQGTEMRSGLLRELGSRYE